MKNRAYTLHKLHKEDFDEHKMPHHFETELNFGSQRIVFGSHKERSIDDLRLCATSVLTLDRQKISVFSGHKLVKK